MVKIKEVSPKIDNFYKNMTNREKLRKIYKNAFMDNHRLKFPVINPFTGKFDCSVAYRSMLRAMLWTDKEPKNLNISTNYYKEIVKNIQKLLNDNKCEK